MEFMNEFTLIDLDSQADAVAQYTQGWSVQNILDWMGQYGEVNKIPMPHNDRAFVFIARAGIHTAFRFTEKDEIIILSDNTTYRPKSEK
jgi:hypothetical protein